jgi:hypothetical protein
MTQRKKSGTTLDEEEAKTVAAGGGKSPFKKITQNLPFHNFEEEPVFIGCYRNTLELGQGANKFHANVFVDVETGEEFFITNAYTIAKSIEETKIKYPEAFADIVFNIEFKGKTTIKGKPFNQFDISVCTLEEYKESKL